MLAEPPTIESAMTRLKKLVYKNRIRLRGEGACARAHGPLLADCLQGLPLQLRCSPGRAGLLHAATCIRYSITTHSTPSDFLVDFDKLRKGKVTP